MTQNIIVIMVLLAIWGSLWIIGQASVKKRKAYIQLMLKEEWGIGHPKEYSYEEFEWISHYYRNRQDRQKVKGIVVDDITWNDLDLDSIFLKMNHTYSNLGEDYLYDMLRRPQTDMEILEERERLITFFIQDEEARRLLQTKFYDIGKTVKVPVSDYIYRLSEVQKKSNLPHYLAIVGVFAAVGIAMFQVVSGVIFFMAVVGINSVTYYKEKKDMDSYINAVSYIMKLLAVSDQFENLEIPEAESYLQQILEEKRKFKKFRAGSSLLVSGRSMGASFMDSILDYLRMLFHVDLIKFNSMIGELQKHITSIEQIMETIGFLDCVIAIGSYRESLNYYTIPKFAERKKAFFYGKEMYHPLIDDPIANDICEEKGVLITGSNASGKSTFLKTAAVNAVFAQTIHTCLAKSYQAPCYQIYSSMALKDNLQGNESYYIVEIKSLKRILNHVNDQIPMLCFVDEVLRGTNTVERVAASAQILKSLARENVMCVAATHDIELTHLLETYYSNYHFQEDVKENDILFNYKLYEGRAVSRNAIKLLGVMGYEKEIICDAEQTAEYFIETGEWKLCM